MTAAAKWATFGGTGAFRRVDVASAVGDRFAELPWCLRILFENVLRHGEDPARVATLADGWLDAGTSTAEIAFRPNRILMHDTTCVPALVDIAALRSAVAERGGTLTACRRCCRSTSLSTTRLRSSISAKGMLWRRTPAARWS